MNKYLFQLQGLKLSPQEAIEALREMELVVPTAHDHDLVLEAIGHYENELNPFGRKSSFAVAA